MYSACDFHQVIYYFYDLGNLTVYIHPFLIQPFPDASSQFLSKYNRMTRTQLHLWKGGKGKWNSLNDNCWKERRYGERWWIREKEICAITNDMKLVKFNTWRNAGKVHSCLLFDSLHDKHGKASIHFSVFWPSPTPPHWRIQKYLLHPTLPTKPSPGAYPEIYIFALNLPSHPSKVVYPEAKKGRNPP